MTDTLRELWDRIDAGPPRVAEVVTAGDRVRRRRRWGTALSAAAAVAAVAVGSALVTGGSDGESDPVPPVAAPDWILNPPEGTRWAGIDRLVLAIPTDWSTERPRCADSPDVNSIYLGGRGGRDCMGAAAMHLALFAAGSDESAELIDQARRTSFDYTSESVGGVEVMTSPGICTGSLPSSCSREIVVPSLGVAARLFSVGEDFSAIAESVRILPEGWTTVPFTSGPVRGSLLPGTPVDVEDAADAGVRPLELPTSGWKPGDRARSALIRGEISLDDEGCVRLGPEPDARYAVWPKGFAAETRDGVLVVIDADGREYVEGTRLRMGGGYWPEEMVKSPCLPPAGTEVAHIESEVEVTSE